MSATKLVVTVSVLFMIAVSSGCATYSSWEGQTEIKENWGKSYALAKEQQILNPDAEENLTPVEGLEGQVGDRIFKGYSSGAGGIKSSQNSTLTIK